MGQNRLRRNARAIVATIAIVFALQVAYVAIAEEPYPAIMMPRFGWAGPTKAETIEISVPEIIMRYDDSTTKVLTQRQLLSNIPEGRHSTIMANVLSPLPDRIPTRRAPPHKYEPPEWLLPGYNLAHVARARTDHIMSLRDWLLGRARESYPVSPAVMCTVNWYTETYPYDLRRRTGTRSSLVGRLEIDLHDASTTKH